MLFIHVMAKLNFPVAPHYSTQDPGGGVGSRSEGWSWVGLGVGLGIRGVELGRFRYM